MSATASSATTGTGAEPAARGWAIIARLIVLMTFLQPFFIGAMFSGYRDGLNAHRINAYALVLLAVAGLVAALRTQRSTPAGRKLVSALAEFTVLLVIVAILGILSHQGYRLHWLHLPAGVAMVGGAMEIQAAVGHLRRPAED